MWDRHSLRNLRVLPHARRLQHVRFKTLVDWSEIKPRDLYCLAGLYQQNDMNIEAEDFVVVVLHSDIHERSSLSTIWET